MRLDKFIANHSAWSRSQVKKLVKQKRVTVDERVIDDSGMPIYPEDCLVTVDESIISYQANQYYMLNKPKNYLCANSSGDYPTVLDLLTGIEAFKKEKLQLVGRLDLNTTGLLLLTDDGQWNHCITSPSSHCNKKYRVELAQPFCKSTIPSFEKGMMLKGEHKRTRPANIEIIADNIVNMTICEGKYHQVKRMFEQTGNKVVSLHRLSIGDIVLDKGLLEGYWRALGPVEVNSVRPK